MIKVYQIYYDDNTKHTLEKAYIPYHNEIKTPFFENSVIEDLIKRDEHKDCDYFGVVSPNLSRKIDNYSKLPQRDSIANLSRRYFTTANFAMLVSKSKADVITFTTHKPHDMIGVGEKWHKGFAKIMKEVLGFIGLKYKVGTQKFPVYFNYFVGRPEIYEEYCKETLFPAMDAMRNDPHIRTLVYQHSQYGAHMIKGKEWCMAHYGRPYPTFHTFILERLFSLWLENKNYKFVSY